MQEDGCQVEASPDYSLSLCLKQANKAGRTPQIWRREGSETE